jgi:putative tryptophan/tyrosine transport system substrate-binding protein
MMQEKPREETTMNQDTIRKIGWLSPNSSPDAVLYGEFLQGLRDEGLIEGKDVEIVLGMGPTLSDRATYLINQNAGLLVTSGTLATQAAQNATVEMQIPIVMVAVGDPVRTGLISSLPNPGGNITGLATLLPQSSARRLELLKGVLSEIVRVAVLLNPENPANEIDWKETETAANQLGVELQRLEVRSPEGLEGAFDAAVNERAQALIVFVDPMLIIHRRRIASLATTHHIPALYGLAEFVEAGGLMAYGPCFPAMYRQAARFVRQILVENKQPNELPVEEPLEFELTFNRAAAEALGTVLPPIVRFRFPRGAEIP